MTTSPAAALGAMWLVLSGCAHRGYSTRTDAEVAFLAPYAAVMSQGCQGRFSLVLERDEDEILTERAISETEVKVQACASALSLTLDCHHPWHGRGWECDAHDFPASRDPGIRSELGQELSSLLGVLGDQSCVTTVERTAYAIQGSGMKSSWVLDQCGEPSTATTLCVRVGRRRVGDCGARNLAR